MYLSQKLIQSLSFWVSILIVNWEQVKMLNSDMVEKVIHVKVTGLNSGLIIKC